jgi:hypothetical protein
MIFLGVRARPRLGCGVLFAEAAAQTFVFDLSAYPRWLVVFVATCVAVVALWILMKVLKWTLWLLIVGVFLGGMAWAGWELMR